jgi:uncharacterized membrane protein YfcA
MTMIPFEIFLMLLFVVAILYSSVGHGGASGYLAIMAIAGVSPGLMKSSALILNIFVAGIAFMSFYRAGHFKWKVFWPFGIASVPAAFIGAQISIDPHLYKIILGICLIVAVARIIYRQKNSTLPLKTPSVLLSLILGLILGFVSGLIGIGGGILLSPLLILLKWSDMKQTAAISAIFILVNSLSGILGLFSKGFYPDTNMLYWILVALSGGIIGSYFGSKKLPVNQLKFVLAGVLSFAALKLFVF